MNKIAFFLITFLFAVKLFAQAEPVKYVHASTEFKKFYNTNKPDSIFNEFSPEMKTTLPEDKFKATTLQLKNQLGSLLKTEFVKYEAPLAIYKATFQNGTFFLNISLDNKDHFTGLLLSPYQAATEDPTVTESPIALKTLAGTISGTLAIPKNAKAKMPVVIIVPGYGQIDRDGNGPKMNANEYRLLTEALGKNGIATVRYDKRRVGQSTSAGKAADMRFDDYFDDVYSLIGMLADDKRFSNIIVLGHGQGSLVGMIASVDERVKAFISLEGNALTADKVLTDIVKRNYPDFLADNFKSVLDTLRRGKINKKVDPSLYPIANPDLQMYILTWWRFDPQAEIKKVKKPVLIIQGSTDLEVDVTNADKLKKNKTNQEVIISNMNYVLKDSPADKEKNIATYTKPDLPLKPELVTTLVEFINKLN